MSALIVNPARPHRVKPRVKKRRPKSFPLRMKLRQVRRQQLVQQERRGSLNAIRVFAIFGEQERSRWWRGIMEDDAQ
jgi:hypothetical protein